MSSEAASFALLKYATCVSLSLDYVMDTSKDYYAILGVLPSIDPDALKAVYRALMKKFHPDVFSGSKAEAERLSVAINEAYAVLSDPKLRAHYDSERGETDSRTKGQYDSQQDIRDSDALLTEEQKEAWNYIIAFQPIVVKHYESLMKWSSQLALQFQITIIELKLSYESEHVRTTLEKDFFHRFFGENEVIQTFVKKCLVEGRKDIAKELNKAIRILGSPKTEAQAKDIIVAAMKKADDVDEILWRQKLDEKQYARVMRMSESWKYPPSITARALSLGITSVLTAEGRVFEIDAYSADASLGLRGKELFRKAGKTVLRDRDLYALVKTVQHFLA